MNDFATSSVGIFTKAQADAYYAALAPASSSRNVIQPTGDFVPLTLRRNASGSTSSTLLIGDETSGSVAAIKADGSYEYSDVGGSASSIKMFYGAKTYVPVGSEQYRPVLILPTVNPTTNTTANMFSGVFSPTIGGSGNISQVYGIYATPTLQNSGTIAFAVGAQTSVGNTGTGAITSAYGFRSQIVQANPSTGSLISTAYGVSSEIIINASAAGSYTTAYHFYGKRSLNGTGTITNLYGLYLEDISGGLTLNYAIFTNAGQVRLGDNLVIAGNRSYTSWTTSGKRLDVQAASLTDTSGSGTIALRTVNSIAIPTLLASNAETLTLSANVYIVGAPIASTNVTQTAKTALLVDTGADAAIGAIIRGNSATQSGDLFQVTKSDGTIHLKVTGAGNTTATITGGAIDGVPVGTTTRALGYFSELREYIGGFAAIFTHANSADRTYTFPDATTTVVGIDTAQTLTNKTLTTPIIAQVIGSTASGGTLTLTSTSNGTKGKIITGVALTVDEVNGLVGIGQSTPTALLDIAGNKSFASWTTTGVNLAIEANTLTDTSGSGTIAFRAANSIGKPTLIGSSVQTLTMSVNLYVAGAPIASTNVTQTDKVAVFIDTGAAAAKGLIIRHAVSQTANAFETQNSGNATLFAVNTSGYVSSLGGTAVTISDSTVTLNNPGGTVSLINNNGTNGSTVTIKAGTSATGTAVIVNVANAERVRWDNAAMTFTDAYNVIFGTTTGTKIGTATSQKLALWNKTPDVQPTNAITAAAFVANTSLIANDTATFGGYTIGQIAAALIRIGALA